MGNWMSLPHLSLITPKLNQAQIYLHRLKDWANIKSHKEDIFSEMPSYIEAYEEG